jgi:hypothetical protein
MLHAISRVERWRKDPLISRIQSHPAIKIKIFLFKSGNLVRIHDQAHEQCRLTEAGRRLPRRAEIDREGDAA